MLQLQIITYSLLKKNCSPETFEALLQNIPSVKAMEYIIERQNGVLYAFSDLQTQKDFINEMRSYLDDKEQNAVEKFLSDNENPVLIMNQSSLFFYAKLLRLPYMEDRPLQREDIRHIYLAYLLCSDFWTKQQDQGFCKTLGNPELMLLKVDLPLSEFKQHKDFRAALYKGTQFFLFCEARHELGQVLKGFLNERNVASWQEYLYNLFIAYEETISLKYISNPDVLGFLVQYLIPSQDWLNGIACADIDYLRNNFLIRISDSEYLALNCNLIVDKMYQGLKFDFVQFARSQKLKFNGRKIKSIADLNQSLGQVFSEEYFLYDLLERIYSKDSIVKFRGSCLRQENVPAEPDYYLRVEDKIFLFEHKDGLLSESCKQSTDVSAMLDEIAGKICHGGTKGKSRKGGGQLLHTIDNIISGQAMSNLDAGWGKAAWIIPILTVTDSAFSTLGLNKAVNKMFCSLACQYNVLDVKSINILPLTIIDIETLLVLSKRLYDEDLDLFDLVSKYQRLICRIQDQLEAPSFSSFIKDEYPEGEMTEEKNKFMLANFLSAICKV